MGINIGDSVTFHIEGWAKHAPANVVAVYFPPHKWGTNEAVYGIIFPQVSSEEYHFWECDLIPLKSEYDEVMEAAEAYASVYPSS